MKRLGIVLGVCLSLVCQFALAAAHRDAPAAVTTITAEEFESFKRDMMRRMAALEAENAALRQGQVQNNEAVVQIRGAQEEVTADSWTDRIAWKGDFRYRYQNDDVDLTGVGSRNRQRIRARPALEAKLTDGVKVGFGLATGSDDPVSSNQTLGSGGSSKDINLDLAYVDWSTPVEGLRLVAGKFKNELVRAGGNGLLWDGDWRPEGAELVYNRGMFFGNALGSWLEGDGGSGDGEQFVWGAQAGLKGEVGPARIRGGASYYHFPLEGDTCLFEADECFGNTAVPDPGNPGEFLYANDFELIEGFVEVDFEVFDLPSQFFVDYVVNDDADEDTGYAVGGRLGKAKKRGSWQASYVYQDLEADAVLGLLADSDFAGGGTDSKGHKFGGAYALTDQAKVKLTYFLTERQDTNGVENGGEEFDVDTLQLDFEFKYK